MLVDRLPATPADDRRHTGSQPRLDRLAGRRRRLGQPAAARSSSNRATVSAAHFLLVPMTPDGPRLIHPTAYSPVRSVPSGSHTRPPSVRISPRRSSKERPGAAGRGSRSSGSRAARDHLVLRGGHARSRLEAVAHHTHAGHPSAAGLAEDLDRRAQKRSSIRCERPLGRRGRELAQDGHVAARGRRGLVAGSSATSGGSTMTSTRASSPSSRSSGVVNAASTGPRRPSTTTSVIEAAASAAIAWSAASVDASSSRVQRRASARRRARRCRCRSRRRACRTDRRPRRRTAGGRCTRRRTRWRDRPRAFLAGEAEPVVARCADRVDDRVVALEQLLAP